MTEATASPAGALSRPYLYTLVFLGGFHVMLLEMCAFRILYFNFGSSIYTSGVLLGLIMVSLAAGYWLGGALARRTRSVGPLLYLLLAAVVYVGVVDVWLVDPIVDWLFSLRKSLSEGVMRGALPPALATLLLMAPPMLVLSQITPFLIKFLGQTRNEESAMTAGRTMAISTVGSIFGTFLTSLYLLPTFGVRPTLLIYAVSMIVVAAAGLVMLRGSLAKGVTAAAVALCSLASFAQSARGDDVIHQEESAYGTVQIVEKKSKVGGRLRRYQPSRLYRHSYTYVGKPLLAQFPLHYVNVGLAFGARSWLVLGVAGGTVLTQLSTLRPNDKITGVDIDPVSLRIARRFFGVPKQVAMHASDARVFVEDTAARYDFILVDVFNGEQIPAHCATMEFFAKLRSRLTANGILAINSNMEDLDWFPGQIKATQAPMRHLRSAVFRAGFASMYQNDAFSGMLFAFKQPVNRQTFFGTLRNLAKTPSNHASVRVSAAVAYLDATEVLPTDARPFTDSWVPETLLHKKGNRQRLIAALKRPSANERANAPQLAKLLISHSRDGKLRDNAYCAAVADAIDAGATRQQVARYFQWRGCVKNNAWLQTRSKVARSRAFTMGLGYAYYDRIKQSLPWLMRALQLFPER